jgi:hypothetical protein
MLATTITLIVMAMAMGTFKNALALNDTVTLIADSSQNLRSGTNGFVRDLMQAGRGIPIGGIPIPSGTGATALVRPAPPVGVLNFDNTTQTTLHAVTTGYQLGPLVNGRLTDIVTILALDPTSYVEYPPLAFNQLPLNYAAPLPAGLAAPLPALADDGASLDVGQFAAWINDPVSGIKAGDLLLFNNQNGTAIQTVTSTSGTTVSFAAGDPFNFNQRTVSRGSIMQILGGGPAFPPTDVIRVQMLTYYLDDVTTPGVPRLMRRVNHFDAQALAGVVDDLTVTYDLVDDRLNPVNPVNQPTVPVTIGGNIFGPNQIRKANLRVAVRSESRSSAQNDYLRSTATTVVSLRSLAYIDRYN